MKAFALVLAAVACFGVWAGGAQAAWGDEASSSEETYTVTVTGTYHQADAYSMLAMINEFRTAKVDHSNGNTPWYKAKDGSYVDVEGLSELKWDSGLEKIAMQRAAEAALRCDITHTRPNGEGAKSLIIDGRGLSAENLSVGSDYEGNSFFEIEPYYYTSQEAFTSWREDDKAYSGQGHRRNMLLPGEWGVGIACLELNGVRYWAIDFGASMGGIPSLKEGAGSVDIEIRNSAIAEYDLSLEDEDVQKGNVVTLPNSVKGTMREGEEGKEATFQASLDKRTWSVKSGSDVVSLSNGAVTALKPGTAILANTALGKEVTCTVTVTEKQTPALSGVPASDSVALSAGTYRLSPSCDSTGVKSFDSSDKSVATVDGDGKVTLRKAGTTTITVSYAEDDDFEAASASCKLTVTDGSGSSSGADSWWTKDPDKDNSWFTPDGTQVIVTPAAATVSAPAKTSISKLAKAKKAFTVKWKKKSGVAGYQVRYSLKSSMKGSKTVTVKSAKTTAKKVTKLKKKKRYYVQVRTYKVVNGKTYWSGWSAKKSVKTK